MPMITSIYAALLALLLIWLAAGIIRRRRGGRVAFGDGGHAELTQRIRAHGNFTEYVPMALLLMAFLELQGITGLILHGLGVALLLGRVVHAAGLLAEPHNIMLRTLGMVLTFAVLAGAAVILLWLAVLRAF